MALEIIIYAVVFIGTYSGVEAFRRWSLRREMVDIPNERSSHTQPTPRGGGLIIVVVALSFYLIYTIFGAREFSPSYFIGAVLVAFISWLDDLYSISFIWRLIVHSLSAFLVILSLAQIQNINQPFFEWGNPKTLSLILTFLWIVWLTNAYNFMDGIDGIAGLQAVAAGIGWLAAGKILDSATVGVYGGVLAFSSLGFLIKNWQPAKIFMGDVGSAFLGYSFGVLPILAAKENAGNAKNYESWLFIGVVLVWLFALDTSFTFLRRILKGEKVWRAHRSHIYQRLVIGGFSHRFVAVCYGALSILNGVFLAAGLWYDSLNAGLYFIIALESIALMALPVWLDGGKMSEVVNRKS